MTDISTLSLQERIALESLLNRKHQRENGVIPRQPRDGRNFPVSFAQERLWFMQEFHGKSSIYNMAVALHIRGTLELRVLLHAFREIFARHEALRTNIVHQHGQLQQIIQPTEHSVTAVIDVTQLGASPNDQKIAEVLKAAAGHPFDLENDSLFRAVIFILGGINHIVLLALHHIIGDSWSLGILARELIALYASGTEQHKVLTRPCIQYADYSVWQREWLTEAEVERQLGYWRAILPQPALQQHSRIKTRIAESGSRHGFSLPGKLADAVISFSGRQGVTPFMTFLAAYAILAKYLFGKDSTIVGTPTVGRPRPELEEVVGLFANLVAVPVSTPGYLTFAQLLADVRDRVLDGLAYQDVPFQRVVQELSPSRDGSDNPLMRIAFALDTFLASTWKGSGLQVEAVSLGSAPPQTDLILHMAQGEHGFDGVFQFDASVVDEAIITCPVFFAEIVRGGTENPSANIDQLILRAERARRDHLAGSILPGSKEAIQKRLPVRRTT